MKRSLSAILIFVILGAVSLGGILAPDHLFSVREKRKLQQVPEFSIAGFWNHSWQEKAEKYVLDQFPGRNAWAVLNQGMNWLVGKRESGNVYLAADGYLIDVFCRFPEALFQENIRSLATFTQTVSSEYGLPVHAILVPTAAHTLKEKLPSGAPSADQKAMTSCLRSAGIPVVDVMTALESHREEALYYRTDHHFTTLGAWYCYQAWRCARGLPEGKEEAWTKEVLCEDFYGTTYAKASLPWILPDSICAWYQNPNRRVTYNGIMQEDSIYHREALSGPEPYGVFLHSNQALTVIEGGGSRGKLLLIKDSFGNTFAQFPAEEFRQVHMIDLRFFREDPGDYIRQNQITDVLVLYGLENFSRDPYIKGLGR